VVINSYINEGQMPFGGKLEASLRDELNEKLIEEYFATDDANPTGDGVFDFQPTSHHWLHGSRYRLRRRSPREQDPRCCVSGPWRFAMAVRAAAT